MPHPPNDITARHLAKVVESSDDAIVSKDLNGIIISWNRAAERMFGYTAAEAVGRSIRMIIPADRQAEEDDVLNRIRRGESVTHFETIRQRQDGSMVPISLTVSPIFGDDGRVIGASKIARDISERVEGAMASRRLEAVVQSSDDAIVTKNLESLITSWNPAAERMFGYTADEAIGKSDPHAHPRRSAGRGRRRDGEDPRRRESRSLRDDPAPQGRQHAVGIADRLADPQRVGHDRRRLEDRARCHRACRDGGGHRRVREQHREAVGGRRGRGLDARSRSRRPAGHRHRDRIDARGVRRVFLQRPRRIG